MAQDICEEREPELVPADSPSHLAACHFHEQLVGVRSAQLFTATSADTEDLTPADLEVQQ
jgi:hypothetical protein